MSEAAVAAETPRYIDYEVRDGVAWVMLDRPAYANSQNYRLLGQLDDMFRRAVEDEAVKAIVLGGHGKHFSAGHDLGTPERDRDDPRERKLLWYSHVGLEGAESRTCSSRTPTSGSAGAGRRFPSR